MVTTVSSPTFFTVVAGFRIVLHFKEPKMYSSNGMTFFSIDNNKYTWIKVALSLCA